MTIDVGVSVRTTVVVPGELAILGLFIIVVDVMGADIVSGVCSAGHKVETRSEDKATGGSSVWTICATGRNL